MNQIPVASLTWSKLHQSTFKETKFLGARDHSYRVTHYVSCQPGALANVSCSTFHAQGHSKSAIHLSKHHASRSLSHHQLEVTEWCSLFICSEFWCISCQCSKILSNQSQALFLHWPITESLSQNLIISKISNETTSCQLKSWIKVSKRIQIPIKPIPS